MNLIECLQKSQNGDKLVYSAGINDDYEYHIRIVNGIHMFQEAGTDIVSTLSEFIEVLKTSATMSNNWFLRRKIEAKPITLTVDECSVDWIGQNHFARVVGLIKAPDELFKYDTGYDISITFTPKSKVQEIRK